MAAEERFKRLRASFEEGQVGLVHGQLPPQQKDEAMARFVAGETKVLAPRPLSKWVLMCRTRQSW